MGYVYFIKHKRLSPIKIGMTDGYLSSRINYFNTASPYGIKLIGFIETDDAKKLELQLHKKLKTFRLNGEWFELNENEAKIIIDNYSCKPNEKKRLSYELPFKIDYEKYSLFQLKCFVKFFSVFFFEQKYDHDLIEKHTGVKSKIETKKLYNEYISITN